METLTPQSIDEQVFEDAQNDVLRMIDNPDVNTTIEGDMEGGESISATDEKGNKVSKYDSSFDITNRAVWHVEGGASQGGKTYRAEVSLGEEPKVTKETPEGNKVIRSSRLAGKVISMAAQSIERNSKKQ